MRTTANLYEKDFFAWTQEQAKYIKDRAFEKLDLTHLFEEIESMGAKEKSELKNRMAQLMMHLLKWKYQPARQCRSWQNTIYDQREELQDLLSDNPSLNSKIDEYFVKSYKKAVREAASETGLDESVFPVNCEWSVEQILTDDFYPN
ncbi:MAG TPA: DUF29 domain-containing protein [Burkholderiales bacterium]|nr:DUF29 domain-containing protein [Burkholderiales bacterium]